MITEPTIKTLSEKKLIGKRLFMTLADNRTHELWKSFMPRRKEITNNLTKDLYSMQVYDTTFNFKDFNPVSTFEKWAAVEVSDFNKVPAEMETYIFVGGMYAVFKLYRTCF